MTLPTNIIKLLLAYTVEPVYKLIPSLSEKMINLPTGCFGTNPKNRYDILARPEKYSFYDIINNPHPKIQKEVMRRTEEFIKKKLDIHDLYINLASVKSNNSDYAKWIEKIIFNYADRLCGNNNTGLIGWASNIQNYLSGQTALHMDSLTGLVSKYRSKKFYDKFYSVPNVDIELIKFGTYPFFLDISEEENQQEFIRLLKNLEKRAPIPEIQRINHPAIINELEIIYGLNPDKSKSSSKFIRKMMGPIELWYVSNNPGAAHILKTIPELKNKCFNTKMSIEESELIKQNPIIMANIFARFDCSKSNGFTNNQLVKLARENMIAQIDMDHNCIFYDPYEKKLINLVYTHLFLC